MSKTILMAVDTAGNVSAAADMAREIAGGAGDRVVVLHVHEFAVGRFGRVQVDCADGEGERVAADIAERLRGAGIEAEIDVRRAYVGQIAKTIVAVSDEVDAQMIILGSTKTHDLPRLPFGSVALKLLHMSDRPVLIVPRPVVQARAAAPATLAVAR